MSPFRRLLKGTRVDEERRIAEELICQMAPDGARFSDTEHTLKYFREELRSTKLMDRHTISAVIKDQETMVENAKDKAERLLKTIPQPLPALPGIEKRNQVHCLCR